MTWEYAGVMFIVMLTAQVPLIVVALINYLKSLEAANKVKEVADTLEISTIINEKKLDTLADSLEVVHKATNSLTDRLVEQKGISEHARGLSEGIAGRKEDANKLLPPST